MKTSSILKFLLAAVWLASAVSLAAQTKPEPANPSPTLSAADRAWLDVQMLATPLPPPANPPPQNPGPDDRSAQRRQRGERFRAAADRAKAFQQNHPDHPKAAEARQLEAKSLLNAAMAGDNSQEAHASALVTEIRHDSRLPAKLRLETVALADIVRVRPLARERERFLAAHEESARSLIAEFPGEAGGYESLLRQAQSHPEDAEAVRIARDVLKMPAPASVKDATQVFLDRHALVGQSLGDIAVAAVGKTNAIAEAKGQGVVIYTWSTKSPGSVAQARNLSKLAPAGAVLVGINLDQNMEAARAFAVKESLPGVQIYDARGLDSPLAQALKLDAAPHVYVADRQGVIREISAERGDLTRKFGAAGR